MESDNFTVQFFSHHYKSTNITIKVDQQIVRQLCPYVLNSGPPYYEDNEDANELQGT